MKLAHVYRGRVPTRAHTLVVSKARRTPPPGGPSFLLYTSARMGQAVCLRVTLQTMQDARVIAPRPAGYVRDAQMGAFACDPVPKVAPGFHDVLLATLPHQYFDRHFCFP